MGLFTRSKITSTTSDHRHQPHYQQSQYSYHQQHRYQQQARRKFSFTDPPNVYLPPAAPLPPRHQLYKHHNHSQPVFQPAGYLAAPPSLDWTAPPAMLMNAGVNNMQQMASSSSSKWTDAVGEIA